ncbi:MAG: S-methyl-5-thioribose-1-phosphate isomerase [Verrucomicrobiales bacterium]|nr:S-methyl-5-thioribose-1-phosphate isomerase [Verrucomicrobiales bacterium]|tara:strand:+ start:15742 stop:16815 length:1074 start_codon:yes stop_codon:yes gene_type:complete
MSRLRTVAFESARNAVVLIDQRRLPHRLTLRRARTFQETATAIANMTVRGAGAIGAAAAYGLAQGVRAFKGTRLGELRRHADRVYKTLRDVRPTAVDPVNAMNTVRAAMAGARTVAGRQQLALEAAEQFAEEDVAHCRAIGEAGAPLIRPGLRVLTHCNAGALAFVDIGSATAPLYAAHVQGVPFHVFCSETRPRGQGAALTAWEMAREGISHEIIADSAAGHLMQRGEIDLVITGGDRVLGRTGEVANKIGTYTHAVLARRHRIPLYVAIPLSTLDWQMTSGAKIPIEEREPEEVLTANGPRGPVCTANPGSGARNPAFDVTPPELISGIITPSGILKPRALWRQRKRLGGPSQQD